MSPVNSIRSYGAGSSIMAATAHQHCIRCSATSTDRWWRGPCENSNAFQVTGHGRVSSSRPSRGKARICSHTGRRELSAGSPDGSCVRRESHAQFYERPEGKPLRPTHHRLHWVLDVVFHDDLARLRTGHGPANMAVVKHMALNLLKQAKPTISLKNRRKRAGRNTDSLAAVIQQAA